MIVIIGESAAGKSSIEKALVEHGYNQIISYTTRPKRINEVEDVDYHYISEQDFLNKLKNGFFAEHTLYNNWYYGIAKEDCIDDSIAVVEPFGFRQLKAIEGLNIKSFYIKADERERLVRMVKRGDNLLEIFRRIFSDQGVFQGINREVNYVIDNSDGKLDNAVNNILQILQGKGD